MKKIVVNIILPISILVLIIMMILIARGNLFISNRYTDSDFLPLEDEAQYITYYVGYGDITDSFKTTGIISSDDEGIVNDIVTKTNSKNFELKKKVGYKFKKNEVIYIYNKKEYRSKYNGKILKVFTEGNNTVIQSINYDKHFLVCYINQEDEPFINSDTKVEIINGKETIRGTISYIGNKIEDQGIPVKIKFDGSFLMGSRLEVKLIKKIKKNVLLVHKDAVIKDGDNTFLEVFSEGTENKKTTRIPIKTGVIDDDIIEITWGDINPGDKVVKVFDEFTNK